MGLKISQLPDKAAEDGMMIPASVGGMTYRLLVGMAGGLAKFLHKHDIADVNDLSASLSNNAADHPHRNLLDNWDFGNPVNQRGQTTATAGSHLVDRWKIYGSGTVSLTSDGVVFSNTIDFGEQIEISRIPLNVPVTFSVLTNLGLKSITHAFVGTLDETVLQDIGNGIVVNIIYNWGNGGTLLFCMQGNNVTVRAAKLELGTVSTLANDPPADYGEELRKCQRYYFQRHFVQYETIAMGYLGASWLNLVLGIGSPMRTDTPTLSVSGALALVGAAASAALTPVNAACSGCSANLGFSTTASTQGACYAYPSDAGGATISLSADL